MVFMVNIMCTQSTSDAIIADSEMNSTDRSTLDLDSRRMAGFDHGLILH